jgi:hypothetical protein
MKVIVTEAMIDRSIALGMGPELGQLLHIPHSVSMGKPQSQNTKPGSLAHSRMY